MTDHPYPDARSRFVSRLRIIGLACLVCSCTSIGETGTGGAATPERTAEIAPVMQSLSASMLTVLRDINSPSPDPESLQQGVDDIRRQLGSAASHFDDDRVHQSAPMDLIDERLSEASRQITSGNLFFVRGALERAFEACADCHSGDRRTRRAFSAQATSGLTPFQAAEFSYHTRDYDTALRQYRAFVESERTASGFATVNQRDRALDRMLTITAQLLDAPGTGARLFAELAEGPSSLEETGRLRDWADALTWLAANRNSRQAPYGKNDIEEMSAYLELEWPGVQARNSWNAAQVWWVVIRGELLRLLDATDGEDAMAETVYWLAVAERSLQYRFYDSLSRHYLQRCVRQFPEHPAAARCLDEYELLMVVSYAGSNGVSLPEPVRAELVEMRQLVNDARKRDASVR